MDKRRTVVRRRAAAALLASVLVTGTSARAGADEQVPAPAPATPVPAPATTSPTVTPGNAPTPVPPADAPVCRGTLDGHVVDAISHEPLVDATVTVGTLVPITTDAKGHFLVTGLCPGVVAIEAGRIDYLLLARTLTIGDGASTSSLEMELRVANVETIEVKGHAPPPVDMRSTASISGAALEQTRGKALAEALAEVPGVT